MGSIRLIVPGRPLSAKLSASGRGWGVQYGYFEARMKLPPGPGTWPAFWLMSLQPAAKLPKVEVDVIEYYGHMTDRFFATTHVWYADDDERVSTHDGVTIRVPPGSLTQEFHNYGVRVDKARSNFLMFTILSSDDTKWDPIALGDYAARNVVPDA